MKEPIKEINNIRKQNKGNWWQYCGKYMLQGAHHGEWTTQYECHNCGKIIIIN